MKKIFTILMVGLLPLVGTSQIVYQEDFNATDGGWVATGANGDWAWGTPAGPVIEAGGTTCSGDAWVTNLTGDYGNNAEEYLTSPVIDCSVLTTDPVLDFKLHYETENCCDEGWVEFTLDGVTWTKLGASGTGTNWYNDAGNDWWDGTNGGWTNVSNTIPGAAGVATLQIRFVFDSDGSVTRDGFGIDDITIADEIINGTSNGVSNISSGLILSNSENIEVSIGNTGASALTGFNVCYVLNGATPVCETVASIPSGGGTYTFTATEDFSVIGDYTIQVYINGITGDISACDDTTTQTITLVDPITTYPSIETFDGSTTWTTENNWEIGMATPGSTFENITGCDVSPVLGTNIAGDYTNSAFDFAYSALYDFSSFTADAVVAFDLFYNTESCCDEGYLEVTFDGGTTWTKVGTSGTGSNWYNDGGNQWWDGTNGGWLYASHTVAGSAGQASAQFRFVFASDGSVTREGFAIDNFTVAAEVIDGAPTGLVGLTSGLTLTATENIEVNISNIGTSALTAFDVCYVINGGTPVCETVTSIASGGGTYTFTATEDFSAAGVYSIQTYVTIAGDLVVCNDTNVTTITLLEPITNDDACDAIAVSVDGATVAYNNVNATLEASTTVTGFNTVWFTFDAPASGHVEVSTCGDDNNFDNFLEVYEVTDCGDFATFTLVDDATGNPFASCTGVNDPSGVNLCGLTPGNTYYLVIGSEVDGSTGVFPLTLTELPAVEAGTALTVEACEDETAFDLFTTITGNATTDGVWYSPNASGSVIPSTFSFAGNPAGTYGFEYVQTEVCGTDNVTVTVDFIATPNMGTGSVLPATCNFGSVGLFDGLSGNVDLGGTWNDGTNDVGSVVTYDGEAAGTYDYYYIVDNGVCAADSTTVTVTLQDCLGLDANEAAALEVYPNPAHDVVTIANLNVEGNANITLFDVQGKIVYTSVITNVNGNYELDLSGFENGVYIIEIRSEISTQNVRVVKH